jgi:hypothetical protein
LFITGWDRNLRIEGAQLMPLDDTDQEWSAQIHVSVDAIKEAISRVENFCNFVEQRTPR